MQLTEKDLNNGDHIFVRRKGLLYSHHGIYAGNRAVIHFKGLEEEKRDPVVIITDINDFLKSGELRRRHYNKRLTPSESLRIAREHLSRLFTQLPIGFESMLQAEKSGDRFCFRAFGEDCCLGPDMITLSGKHIADPRVVLISLYASHASPEPVRLEPFMSFRDLPNSMPYQGAFRANSESVIVSHVRSINHKQQTIKELY